MSLEKAQEVINSQKDKNSTKLDLGSFDLSPEDLSNLIEDNNEFFKNLVVLRLNKNNIRILPESIYSLSKLQELLFPHNQFAQCLSLPHSAQH